jgi:hypothetical protein
LFSYVSLPGREVTVLESTHMLSSILPTAMGAKIQLLCQPRLLSFFSYVTSSVFCVKEVHVGGHPGLTGVRGTSGHQKRPKGGDFAWGQKGVGTLGTGPLALQARQGSMQGQAPAEEPCPSQAPSHSAHSGGDGRVPADQ